MGSSGPGGYATEIGRVVLMPLQLKSGGLASNFAFFNIFAYVYIVIIFSLFQVNRHSPCLRGEGRPGREGSRRLYFMHGTL